MNGANGNIAIPALSISGTGKGRANFTSYHLLAAKTAHLSAYDIDQKYKTTMPPQEELNLYLSQVSTAIICSVAALEANINEYIVDNTSPLDKIQIQLNTDVVKRYPRVNQTALSKQLLDDTNIIFKYDIIWMVKKARLLLENSITQDIRYLSRLRNSLIHFTPEWDNDLVKHIDLEKDRKNKFTLSPFFDSGVFFFPHQCLRLHAPNGRAKQALTS